MSAGKSAIVALGGNALSPGNKADTIANQFRRTRESLTAVMYLLHQGYNLAITHGNGPQVGNALLRVELARDQAPVLPLGICVADTQGGMGYMIEQSLQNALREDKASRDVVTIVTQVIVDRDDPSIQNPTKFIGRFYTESEAKELAKKNNWAVKYDSGHDAWRRVVPSPIPREIVNRKPIQQLVDSGTVVIAAGGGGIPVYLDEDGDYEGFDAVIDKDRAAAILGRDIHANELFIITDVSEVYVDYKQEKQRPLHTVSLDEIRSLYHEDQFPAGSMGPKIEAAIQFLECGGEKVTITSIEFLRDALENRRGTRIIR